MLLLELHFSEATMACKVCKKQYKHSAEASSLNADEKPHVCVTCGKSFSLKIQLKKHMQMHEDGKPYVCYSCEKNSSLSYNLRQTKKGAYSVLDSDDCEESFKNASELEEHTSVHKTTRKLSKKLKVDHDKRYTCSDCKRSFTQLYALKKHRLSHTKFECSDCHTKFFFLKDLDHHQENECASKKDSVEDDTKKYACLVCHKAFARKSALEGHVVAHVDEKIESGAEDDSVEDEDFSYDTPSEKSNQNKDSQPKGMCLPKLKLRRSYPCDNCSKVCASESLLEKHLLSHKKAKKASQCPVKRKYRCRVCKELLLSKSDYKTHKTSHGPEEKSSDNVKKIKTYLCEICMADFSKKKHLKKHMKIHSSNSVPQDPNSKKNRKKICKKKKNHSCPTCGKLFAGLICLKKHELKHEVGTPDASKPKKYRNTVTLICPFCNEDFTGRKLLFIRHKLAHTPEVCGICDERFVDRAALREHLKTHIGTDEARKFLECSHKVQSMKNSEQPEPKVEYIYLVLR